MLCYVVGKVLRFAARLELQQGQLVLAFRVHAHNLHGLLGSLRSTSSAHKPR